jgi:MFS family permease
MIPPDTTLLTHERSRSMAIATPDPMAPTADDRESHASYAGWPVVAASAVGVFFAALIVVTFPVFLKPWSAEFGWSRRDVSVAFGIAAAVAGICAAPLGALLDRIGVRRIAVPSLVMLGVAFASMGALTPSLPHLYGTFAVLGLAGIGTSPVAYARAVSSWFQARRGLALALVITGGALGGMLHPIVAEALVRSIGWRGACVAFGAAVLVAGVPMAARFVREAPDSAAVVAQHEGVSVAEGLRTWVFWVLAAVQLCATLVQNSVIVHLSALLTDRGILPAQAAVALAAMAFSAVVGRVVTGLVLDRVVAVGLLVALMALASAGAFLLSGAAALGVGVAAAMLVGFGTGGEADVVPYMLSRYFGLRSFSTLYGLVWLANAIGGAVGPVVTGRAFDRSGSYEQILVTFSLVVLGAAGLALVLPRPRSVSAALR